MRNDRDENINEEEIERLNIARDAYQAGRLDAEKLKNIIAVSSAIRKWLQAPAYTNDRCGFFTCEKKGYISRIDCIRFAFSGQADSDCLNCGRVSKAWCEMTKRDRGVQKDGDGGK